MTMPAVEATVFVLAPGLLETFEKNQRGLPLEGITRIVRQARNDLYLSLVYMGIGIFTLLISPPDLARDGSSCDAICVGIGSAVVGSALVLSVKRLKEIAQIFCRAIVLQIKGNEPALQALLSRHAF